LRKSLSSVLVVAGLAVIVLVALDVVTPGLAVALAALLVAAAVLSLVFSLQMQVAKLDARLRRLSDKELESIETASTRLRDKLVSRLDERAAVVEEKLTKNFERIKASDQQRSRQFESAARASTRRGRHDYQQLVAWIELRDLLEPEGFMPPLRGWAASPDVVRLLVDVIRAGTTRLVVECGSGSSSVWLGLALKRFGGGRLVALEHDEEFCATSRAMVAAYGLDDIVEVRHAPLTAWDGGPETQPWYDLSAVEELKDIDLLLVDGPPEATGPQARYPAGPVLFPRCKSGCTVLLDDAGRPDEQVLSDRWCQAFPDFVRTIPETEKGAHLFVRE
jgi:predicted O-methyltransferase YrrM